MVNPTIKKVLTIVGLFLFAPVFPQDTVFDKKSATYDRLYFGFNVSHNACYRRATSYSNTYNLGEYLHYNLSIPSPVSSNTSVPIYKYGLGFGFDLAYNFRKRLAIQTGLNYVDMGYQTKFNIDTRIYHYNFMEIPLKLTYGGFNGKRRVFFSVGVNASVLLNERVNNFTADYNHNGSLDFNSYKVTADNKIFNSAATISLGWDKRISSNLLARFEPTFTCYLFNIKKTELSERLRSFGLKISYYYVPNGSWNKRVASTSKKNTQPTDSAGLVKYNERKATERGFFSYNEITLAREFISKQFYTSIKSTNGYQFNPYFNLGVGVGVDLNYFYLFPVTLNSQVAFSKKRFRPFVSFGGGVLMDLESDVKDGKVLESSLGLKIRTHRKMSYFITGGYRRWMYSRFVTHFIYDNQQNSFLTFSTGLSF